MARTLDLRCPRCETTEDDVVLGQSEPLPPCPDCGAERTISWASGKAPGLKVYQPVYDDARGRYLSEDEWKQHRIAVAATQKCDVEQIVAHRTTKTENITRGEEIRHRAAVRKKKLGISADVEKDIRETAKRTGVNPMSGKKAPSKRTPR